MNESTDSPGSRQAVRGWFALGAAGLVSIGIFYGLYSLGWRMINSVLDLDKDVAAAIIATSGTVLAAVATVMYSQNRSKRREIDESHRTEKAKIYTKFMALMVQQIQRVKADDPSEANGGGAEVPQDLVDDLLTFKRDLIVWGSPAVIRAYGNLDAGLVPGDARTFIVLADEVLRAMRRDLGNSNRRLRKGELWALFLTPDARRELGGDG